MQIWDSRDYVYSEHDSIKSPGWTIRSSQYKLIDFFDGTKELYDLLRDPYEKNDLLVSNNKFSGIVTELEDQAKLIKN